MAQNTLKTSTAILWTAAYFGIMVLYTFLDIAVWRKLFPGYSDWVNIITIIILGCGFIYLLMQKYKVDILSGITASGILGAVFCSVLFFLLLDNCLDPVFESIFPQSEKDYQETIQSLINSPVIEEILMRGFVLGLSEKSLGAIKALLVSSLLFAILHFNMVQTLSAFVCGIILGLLYLKTKSVVCCIIAHCGYNLASYITVIYPYIK